MKKMIYISLFLGLLHEVTAQAVVTATNVRLNCTAGTRLVIQGGISFTGTSLITDNGRIDILTNPAGPVSNWTDATAGGAYDVNSTGHVYFSASALQTITGPTRFFDLTMDGTTGISLGSNIEVRDNLFLNGGVFTTGVNKVYVSNGAVNAIQTTFAGGISSGSFPHFINGRLERFTNLASTDYLWPVGKDGGAVDYYAPIRINKINANTARYTAEYFRAVPFDRSNRQNPPLNRVSGVEYWEITSDVPGGSTDDDAVLSLSWRTQSYISTNAADWTSLNIAHYRNNAGFRWEPAGVSNAVLGTASFGWVTSDITVGSFTPPAGGDYRFTLASRIPNNVLPVSSIEWSAAAVNKTAVIKWNIENDKDAELYIVERSYDGRIFSDIGTTASQKTTGFAFYSLTDEKPYSGVNYYRIRIKDKTGATAYTNIQKLIFESNAVVKLFPVPASTILTLQLAAPPSYGNSLQIITVDGKVVYQTSTLQQTMQLQIKDLLPGQYFIRYVNGKEIQTYPFIKAGF